MIIHSFSFGLSVVHRALELQLKIDSHSLC